MPDAIYPDSIWFSDSKADPTYLCTYPSLDIGVARWLQWLHHQVRACMRQLWGCCTIRVKGWSGCPVDCQRLVWSYTHKMYTIREPGFLHSFDGPCHFVFWSSPWSDLSFHWGFSYCQSCWNEWVQAGGDEAEDDAMLQAALQLSMLEQWCPKPTGTPELLQRVHL